MTNPVLLERQLEVLSRELMAADADLARLDADLVGADHKYEVAFAKAILTADGGNAESRRAQATLDTEDLAFVRRVAEQQVRAAKSKVATLRTRIDVGRTLAASARTSWDIAGRGTT